jgi:5'-methylthioadenosine phosphorylase
MPIDGPIEIGVIAGVGQSGLFESETCVDVPTPYGSTSEPIQIGELGGRRVAVLARRGAGEVLQPHLVPYRANIWALASLGVKALITTTASSGLRDAYSPGTFVIGDQVIDLTSGRASTFYDEGPAVQLAAAELFDPTLRALASEALAQQRVRYRDFGTTVVLNGPRFSTAAEARWHASMGGDLANMTLMPETPLALELGLAVVNVSFITDRDAGTAQDHSDATNLDLVRRRVASSERTLMAVLEGVAGRIPRGFTPASSIPRDRIEAVLARSVQGETGGWSAADVTTGASDVVYAI